MQIQGINLSSPTQSTSARARSLALVQCIARTGLTIIDLDVLVAGTLNGGFVLGRLSVGHRAASQNHLDVLPLSIFNVGHVATAPVPLAMFCFLALPCLSQGEPSNDTPV